MKDVLSVEKSTRGVQSRSTAPRDLLRNSFHRFFFRVLFTYDYSYREPQWEGGGVQGVGYKVKNKSTKMAEGNNYQLWLYRKKGKSTVEFLDWKLCYGVVL